MSLTFSRNDRCILSYRWNCISLHSVHFLETIVLSQQTLQILWHVGLYALRSFLKYHYMGWLNPLHYRWRPNVSLFNNRRSPFRIACWATISSIFCSTEEIYADKFLLYLRVLSICLLQTALLDQPVVAFVVLWKINRFLFLLQEGEYKLSKHKHTWN